MRKKKKFSNEYLAQEIGVHRNTISKWNKDESIDDSMKYVKYLNLTEQDPFKKLEEWETKKNSIE